MFIQVIRANLEEQEKQQFDNIPWFNNQDNGLHNPQGRSDSYDHWFFILTFLNCFPVYYIFFVIYSLLPSSSYVYITRITHVSHIPHAVVH